MRMTRRMAERYRRAMVEGAQVLPDAEAVSVPWLFKRWDGNGAELKAGERVCDGGVLYTVLQDHTTQATWIPSVTPSLFARVLIPDEGQIYDWKQPDSTNGYKIGDKARHNGMVWESDYDNNSWEPGVFGWHVVSE